jgi:hypothetical protein
MCPERSCASCIKFQPHCTGAGGKGRKEGVPKYVPAFHAVATISDGGSLSDVEKTCSSSQFLSTQVDKAVHFLLPEALATWSAAHRKCARFVTFLHCRHGGCHWSTTNGSVSETQFLLSSSMTGCKNCAFPGAKAEVSGSLVEPVPGEGTTLSVRVAVLIRMSPLILEFRLPDVCPLPSMPPLEMGVCSLSAVQTVPSTLLTEHSRLCAAFRALLDPTEGILCEVFQAVELDAASLPSEATADTTAEAEGAISLGLRPQQPPSLFNAHQKKERAALSEKGANEGILV